MPFNARSLRNLLELIRRRVIIAKQDMGGVNEYRTFSALRVKGDAGELGKRLKGFRDWACPSRNHSAR
jgi:hypothetical protein